MKFISRPKKWTANRRARRNATCLESVSKLCLGLWWIITHLEISITLVWSRFNDCGWDRYVVYYEYDSRWENIEVLFIELNDVSFYSEYEEARDWIDTSFNLDSDSVDKFNSHFEVTIRVLGGLLSAYHLSADETFLKRAVSIEEVIYFDWIVVFHADWVGWSALVEFQYTDRSPSCWNQYQTQSFQWLSVWGIDFLHRDLVELFCLDGHLILQHLKLAQCKWKCEIYHVYPVTRNTKWVRRHLLHRPLTWIRLFRLGSGW